MNDNQNQAISDDQELTKVLQGMQQQGRTMVTSDPGAPVQQQPSVDPAMQYEATPAPGSTTENAVVPPSPAVPEPVASAPEPVTQPVVAPPAPEPTPAYAAPPSVAPGSVSSSLENLKREALEELRPLVSKLDMPAKEKFDTMLLIIRSTDDQELLQPAHEAAKSIEDDGERAEALLDIVKEIDYFASQRH